MSSVSRSVEVNRCLAFLVLAALSATGLLAQSAEIDFSELKVGTELTVKYRGFSDSTIVKKYVGLEGEHHVFEESKLLEDGSRELVTRHFFDSEGRLLYVMKGDKRSRTYTPFSCEYVLGDCEHKLEYLNPFKKTYVVNEGRYRNRLDGETLLLGAFKSDGEMFEVPFELGPHNLRVSNEYENALGQETGYSFVGFETPE